MSKKPVLYWGVVPERSSSKYRVIRVTRDAGHQISGVRVGDIGAVTLRKWDLHGRFATEEQANAAIQQAGTIRAPYEAEARRLDDLARDQRRQMQDHEKKVFAEMSGALKDGQCL